MRKSFHIFIWKKAPFLRLLIPVICGILFQFYFKIPINIITVSAIILLPIFILFTFLPEAIHFRFKMIQGILISLFLILFGSLITWQKDVRNQPKWYGNFGDSGGFMVATINEPPVEKAKSFKALASVGSVINKGVQRNTKGKILFYFSKDSASQKLKYGDRIIFEKPPSGIVFGQISVDFNLVIKSFRSSHQLDSFFFVEWIILFNNRHNFTLYDFHFIPLLSY
jgi:competence protein ComEC